MQPPAARLPDGRCYRRGLEAVQRGLEPVVVADRRAAPGEGQDLVWRGGHQA